MSTNNAINNVAAPALQTTTGFATWTGAGSYFDDTTLGSFTVLRGGTGYIKSVPVTWLGGQSVNGMTAGNTYYIYMDDTGTIGKTSTRSDALFMDYIVLFECLRDSTLPTNNQFTVRENHPYQFPVEASNFDHDIIGCVIENKNNGANITLNGTQKIAISGADLLDDHGLETTIPDSGGVAVVFKKFFTNGAGKWCLYSDTDTFSGHYNNGGTVTALTAGRFAVYTLYVSKESLNTSTPTYFAVINTAEYSNSTNANNAISNGTVAQATNELAQIEISQLGYIIFRQSTNAISQVTISKSTLRQTLSTGGTNTASLVNTVTTNFNSILSAADTNVQAALDTLDDYGVSPFATGDTGGVISTTRITNATDVSANGVGTLTIKSKSANSADSVGFVKIYVGTNVYWVPFFTTPTP